MQAAMNDTQKVANRFVELVREGKTFDVLDELYADDIVSVEAHDGGPEMPKTQSGIETIKGKNKWFYENHEVHQASVSEPYPHDDKFIVKMQIDVTPKVGPMAGQRFQMEEMCLYTVSNGKIAREEFFYTVPGSCA